MAFESPGRVAEPLFSTNERSRHAHHREELGQKKSRFIAWTYLKAARLEQEIAENLRRLGRGVWRG